MFVGPQRSQLNHENATLEVRKIPADMNNIARLNEHFCKFGTIVNLQVNFCCVYEYVNI